MRWLLGLAPAAFLFVKISLMSENGRWMSEFSKWMSENRASMSEFHHPLSESIL